MKWTLWRRIAWVVLHCNCRIGARERRQLIPHVRFQVPFLGRKVNWNQASHVRASPAMLSSLLVLQMPANWSADQQPCFLLLVGFALFCLCALFGFVCLFCCCFVSARCQPMDCVLIHFSSLLYAHCRHDWCWHGFNSVNLQNAIVFPAW